MLWSLFLLSTTVLTSIYYLAYLALAITFRVNNPHYFLGFGNGLFEFRIKGVLFTIGIFIPIFGLARLYKVENNIRSRPDYPWQFFGRPLWMRILVTYSGVIALFLSALIILIGVRFFVSEQFISRDEINKHGIYPSPLAEQYGFQRGDKVLTVNGREYESYDELLDPDVYAEAGNTFKILRNGEERTIRVPEGDHDDVGGHLFLNVISPVVIKSLMTGSAAAESELRKGDRIVSVNGVSVDNVYDMRNEFYKDVDRTVHLEIQRVNKSDTMTIELEAPLDEQYKLGIITEQISYTTKVNSFPEAVQKGTKVTFQLALFQIRVWFKSVIPERRGDGGPISVSSVFANGPNWQAFWYLTANWAIFFMGWNFCPFPRSAFWEAIPLTYEGVTRKRFSYSLFSRSRALAWFIFWGLILYTMVMDLKKLFWS